MMVKIRWTVHFMLWLILCVCCIRKAVSFTRQATRDEFSGLQLANLPASWMSILLMGVLL